MKPQYEVGDLVRTPSMKYGVIIGFEEFNIHHLRAFIFVPGEGVISCTEYLLRFVDESR